MSTNLTNLSVKHKHGNVSIRLDATAPWGAPIVAISEVWRLPAHEGYKVVQAVSCGKETFSEQNTTEHLDITVVAARAALKLAVDVANITCK